MMYDWVTKDKKPQTSGWERGKTYKCLKSLPSPKYGCEYDVFCKGRYYKVAQGVCDEDGNLFLVDETNELWDTTPVEFVKRRKL